MNLLDARKSRKSLFVSAAVVLALSACGEPKTKAGPVDSGGVADAGSNDAGSVADSGTVATDVGGVSDIGSTGDSGAADLGVSDLGAGDLGQQDTGQQDVGQQDAGQQDLGGASDAGMSGDVGVADAGFDAGFDAGQDAGACPGGVTPTALQLVINEIHAAPDSDHDVNCDGVFDSSYEEFIEIVNTTDTTLDTTGIDLLEGTSVVYSMTECLPPYGALLVYRNTRISSANCTLGSSVEVAYASFVLSNSLGGTVSIMDGSTLIDSVTYPALSAARTSWVRNPDYTGSDFVEHNTVNSNLDSSPGTCTDGSLFPTCSP